MFCSNCGKLNNEKAMFCGGCGRPISPTVNIGGGYRPKRVSFGIVLSQRIVVTILALLVFVAPLFRGIFLIRDDYSTIWHIWEGLIRGGSITTHYLFERPTLEIWSIVILAVCLPIAAIDSFVRSFTSRPWKIMSSAITECVITGFFVFMSSRVCSVFMFSIFFLSIASLVLSIVANTQHD